MSKLLSPLFALAPVVQGVGATAFPPDALVPPMEGIVFLDLVDERRVMTSSMANSVADWDMPLHMDTFQLR